MPVTGPTGKLRQMCIADGHVDEDILTIPDDVGGRFSVLTAVGRQWCRHAFGNR